jgi:putative phage-type endonuclease
MENKHYIEVKIKQGSPEWLLWRRLHITATDTAKVLGKSPYGNPYTCYQEKIEGKTVEMNAAMQRGVDLEPIARDFLIKKYGFHMDPKCFESTKYRFMVASLDAVNDDNTFGVEIKCTGEKTMKNALEGKVDEIYRWQCQKQMLVMGWDHMILFYYFDDVVNIEINIVRDEKMIEQIIKEETNFWNNHLLKLSPPEPPFEEIDCPVSNDLANQLYELKTSERLIKEEIKALEKELSEIHKDQKCNFIHSKVKLNWIERPGTVNWKEIQSEFNISDDVVEKHRKPSIKYSSFLIGK